MRVCLRSTKPHISILKQILKYGVELCHNRAMDKFQAARLCESLSSPLRLDIYELLMKQGAVGLVAGEISVAMALPASNLSFHLKVLSHGGLVTMEQQGRFIRYRANPELASDFINYLKTGLSPA